MTDVVAVNFLVKNTTLFYFKYAICYSRAAGVKVLTGIATILRPNVQKKTRSEYQYQFRVVYSTAIVLYIL